MRPGETGSENGEQVRISVEHIPVGIAQFDREMRYIVASRRWLRDHGLTDDVVGRSHYEIFPDLPEAWTQVHRRTLAGEVLRSEGDRIERADGSVQWVKWETLPWRTASGEIGGILIASEDVTERKVAEEQVLRLNTELEARVVTRTAELVEANHKLAHRGEQLHRLMLELSRTEERQRRRLAQVLHDQVQQLLYGARLHVGLIADQTPSGAAHASAARATHLIDEATEAARLLAVELSPPLLHDAGLVAALHWLGDWMKQNHGLTVQVTSSTTVAPDADGVSLLLFQCSRELLFNVVKHAGVASARVVVERADRNVVRVIIADSGQGFDLANVREASVGLFSIRERLQLVGGSINIDSAPGRGTRVTLQASLPEPVFPITTTDLRLP